MPSQFTHTSHVHAMVPAHRTSTRLSHPLASRLTPLLKPPQFAYPCAPRNHHGRSRPRKRRKSTLACAPLVPAFDSGHRPVRYTRPSPTPAAPAQPVCQTALSLLCAALRKRPGIPGASNRARTDSGERSVSTRARRQSRSFGTGTLSTPRSVSPCDAAAAARIYSPPPSRSARACHARLLASKFAARCECVATHTRCLRRLSQRYACPSHVHTTDNVKDACCGPSKATTNPCTAPTAHLARAPAASDADAAADTDTDIDSAARRRRFAPSATSAASDAPDAPVPAPTPPVHATRTSALHLYVVLLRVGPRCAPCYVECGGGQWPRVVPVRPASVSPDAGPRTTDLTPALIADDAGPLAFSGASHSCRACFRCRVRTSTRRLTRRLRFCAAGARTHARSSWRVWLRSTASSSRGKSAAADPQSTALPSRSWPYSYRAATCLLTACPWPCTRACTRVSHTRGRTRSGRSPVPLLARQATARPFAAYTWRTRTS